MEFGPQDGEESAHPGVEQFAEHARHRWNPYRSISVLEQLHPSDDGKVGKRRGVTDDANEPRLPEPRSCRIGGECRAPPAPRRRRSSPKPPFARPVRGSGRSEFGELRSDDAGFRKAQGCLNVSAGEFRVALEQGVPGFPIGKLAENGRVMPSCAMQFSNTVPRRARPPPENGPPQIMVRRRHRRRRERSAIRFRLR